MKEREGRQIEEAVGRANCCEVSPWGYRLILFTELPSAGTIDSEQWQTQSILMIPLQDSQQLKLAKWKFQLLGILQ